MGTSGPLGSRGEIGLLRGPSAQLAYLLRRGRIENYFSISNICRIPRDMEDIECERKKKKSETRERERGEWWWGGLWWDFYVRSYGGLSRLCSEGPWHLSIFCPFSPKLFSYLRSLSDRHTFLKIDSRSTATVTRSQRERERLLKATSNQRCQTDSVLNSCLGSLFRFSLKEKERSWSFFLFYRSILLSLFLILPMTSFSIYLASVYLARVSSSTCLSLDLRCINSSPSQ